MAMTKDGKHKSNKFKASRYDRENAPAVSDKDKEPAAAKPAAAKKPAAPDGGPRAQMHSMEGRGEGNPETHESEPDGDESMEGMEGMEEGGEGGPGPGPGLHDEVKQVMADHGPAHTLHITHDHEAGKSHIHSIHADGHEHHADHEGEMHHAHAHHHAAHAAGVPPEHIADGEHEGMEHGGPMDMMSGGGGGGEESYGEPL